MNNKIETNGSVVYYVVRVNGKDVSPKLMSQILAEMERQKLEPELQKIAEIVSVTQDGKQLLFG